MKTTENIDWIIEKLPYTEPFLFVDKLIAVTANSAHGEFTFQREMDFFKGHFIDNPITPGVILTECCAQIGLVCLGIFLLRDESGLENLQIGMSSAEMEFLKPVFPGEKVTVTSDKIYFRFGKLKCEVKMYNAQDELVCKGILSGMLKIRHHG
ncbi:3-hydroxyacyl-ACP dehydratase FabZ family protein [Maribacter sp. 2304DJ31-5]|uniref:3-hydroxyacyl-ACP dehydratase FabZ family protein n=1 Tax=Maribacter sp. 2304DJ31-5 TaxID=3386273 RepID=UPI0039BCB983